MAFSREGELILGPVDVYCSWQLMWARPLEWALPCQQELSDLTEHEQDGVQGWHQT